MRKTKEKPRRRHCGHAFWLRVQRARRVHRELTAQGAAVQLLAVFSVLVGAMPLVPSPSTSRAYVPPPRREPSYRPPLTIDEAMRIVRGARSVTPRVQAALDVMKRVAPAAARWIDDKAYWLEWSDVTRCLVPGNEAETAERMEGAAAAWQEEKDGKKKRKRKKGPKVDSSTFEP